VGERTAPLVDQDKTVTDVEKGLTMAEQISDLEAALSPMERRYRRKMPHGRKRHRKKMAKKLAALPKPFTVLGKIFANVITKTIAQPWFGFSVLASDDEYLAWENAQHPWWTRTKR